MSGGDGFLSALQMDLKAKGEPYDLSGKKKKAEGGLPAKKGAGNAHKKKRGRPSAADLEAAESGTSTPAREESGDEDEASERKLEVIGESSIPRKEVFTCRLTFDQMMYRKLIKQIIHLLHHHPSSQRRNTATSQVFTQPIPTRGLS